MVAMGTEPSGSDDTFWVTDAPGAAQPIVEALAKDGVAACQVASGRGLKLFKLAGFYQRVWKRKGKDFTFGQDPRGSTNRDPYHAHYGVGNAKWTSTVTSKLLVEAGYSTSYQHWSGLNQPGRN